MTPTVAPESTDTHLAAELRAALRESGIANAMPAPRTCELCGHTGETRWEKPGTFAMQTCADEKACRERRRVQCEERQRLEDERMARFRAEFYGQPVHA